MIKTLVLGLLTAALAVVVWLITSWLGLSAFNGLLGVGGGLVLGLIRQGSPLARYGAFLLGLVLGLLAAVGGVAGPVGFLVAVVLLTIVSALTGGRLPLWAMILGAGVFASMYSAALLGQAWFFLTQYPSAFFVALATSSGGFIIAVFVEVLYDEAEEIEEDIGEKRRERAELAEQPTDGGAK